MAYPISDDLRQRFANEEIQTVEITVTPTTGEPFTITNADILLGSFMIDRTIMEGTSLNLGSCVASELSMTLFNGDGEFDGVVWSGAELSVEIGVEGSNETIPMGLFYIDRTPKSRTTISISALDGMTKFDKLLSETGYWRIELDSGSWSPMGFVNWCCTKCGVTLATTLNDFPNATWSLWGGFYNYFTSSAGRNCTCRDLLGWAVAIMGKVAWMNTEGELEVGFADKLSSWEGSAVADIAIAGVAIVGNSSGSGSVKDRFGRSRRYSSDYEDTDIEITGISFTKDDTTYLAGTADYTFDLSKNVLLALIESCDSTYNPDWGTKTKADMINNLSGLIGFTYTPVEMTVIPCPHIFPSDWVSYMVDESRTIYTLVTNFTFNLNGHNFIGARGEMPYDKALPTTGSFISVQRQTYDTVDFVVEEGTKGGWYYRKWNSGRYECWYNGSYTVDITTASGSLYYGRINSISYPITFTEIPTLILTTTGNANAMWISANNTGSTSGTGRMYVFRATSVSSQPVRLNIYAHGTWK